jgi:hypothetical protein
MPKVAQIKWDKVAEADIRLMDHAISRDSGGVNQLFWLD